MSPRDPGRRTTGCYIERTTSGRGRLCFRWPPGKAGKLYRITTELDADNDRDELERARDLVGAEIRAGIFDPALRFPTAFAPKLVMPQTFDASRRTLAVLLKAWIDETAKLKVRASRIRDYRNHLKNYVLSSEIGRREPASLTAEDFRAFKTWLRSEAGEKGRGVSEKTAANIIRGTLKAFLRDTDRALPLAELGRVKWEDTAPTREQYPFEAADRDRILAWFKKRRPFEEYVSLRLRFLGASPSEVRGFNVGDYDRRNKALLVRRSRDLGEIGATKTRARRRPVFLGEDVAAEVSTLCGLRKADEPLIRLPEDTLRDNFTKAQAALGITHRSLYQTKHTFASLALEEGWAPALVARNLGISFETLGRHYASALQKGLVGNPLRGVSGRIRSVQTEKRPRRNRASR